MNLQIISAKVLVNTSHTFRFNDTIRQYFIGFSRFLIKYDTYYSHHVLEISINLSNIIVNGNQLTITPNLVMNDACGNIQSTNSTIEIVVLASIGNGNQNVYLQSAVNTNERQNLPLNNITFIQTSLFSICSKFEDRDHHLARYSTNINIIRPALNYYTLRGESIIKNESVNYAKGTIQGSVIAFNGNNHDVLCGYFHADESSIVKVDLGDSFPGFHANEYSFNCFLNGFDISYENGNDHHVMEINLISKKDQNRLQVENNRILAKIKLEATLKDKMYHCTKYPHNKISGFVIAVKNIPPNNA